VFPDIIAIAWPVTKKIDKWISTFARLCYLCLNDEEVAALIHTPKIAGPNCFTNDR
jgi:hypothetical protein